jgi:nitroreductase
MEFIELVKLRRSVRRYLDRPVEDEKLSYILDCGRLAPSACNYQPWFFVVVESPEAKGRLGEAYKPTWLVSAPVVIVVCADHSKAWVRADGKKYADVDAAIAMDHITLAAAEKGLGTCWVGAFNEKAVRGALHLPDHIEPVVMTPLGYPADPVPQKARKSLQEILRRDAFGLQP